MLHINIVLHEPEIPQNTGNIARTCAVTGASLHLIEPLGFELSDRTIKRAGLDYWQYLTVSRYKNWDEFAEKNSGEFYYCSTKGQKCHYENKHSHTAYPVGKASPHKHTVGKILNSLYNARAGRCKAGGDLKKAVDKAESCCVVIHQTV